LTQQSRERESYIKKGGERGGEGEEVVAKKKHQSRTRTLMNEREVISKIETIT